MESISRLAIEPITAPATLWIHRVSSLARGIFLNHRPLYWSSHWHHERTFPCTMAMLQCCHLCDAHPKRTHAYLAARLLKINSPAETGIIELPVSEFGEDTDLYGKRFEATRRSKRSPVQVTITERPAESSAPPAEIDRIVTVRALCRLYSLPDPWMYEGEEEWLTKVRIRVSSPDYSPARAPRTCDQS